MDYLGIIKVMFGLETILDATGTPLVTLAYDGEGQLVIERWDIPFPQPTLAEIEAYATSPEYLAYVAAHEAEQAEIQEMLDSINAEIDWLNTTIPTIDAMTNI